LDDIDLRWSDEKNELLRKERNVCFEDIATGIANGKLLDIIKNPSADREKQYCLIIDIGNYAYVVPFVMLSQATFFLKTIYPSRKQTKKYLKE